MKRRTVRKSRKPVDKKGGKESTKRKTKLCSSVRIQEVEVGTAAEVDSAEAEEGVEEVAGKGGSLALVWENAGTAGRKDILE